MGTDSAYRYNLDNFEAVFREFLIIDKVSPITLKNYLSDLRHFLGWFTFYLRSARQNNENTQESTSSSLAALIDIEAVSSYRSYLEANGLPVKTINRRLSTVRKFCSFCISQGWMKENPAKQVSNTLGVHATDNKANIAHYSNPELHTKHASQNTAATVNTLMHEYRQYLGTNKATEKEISLASDDIEEFFNVINS